MSMPHISQKLFNKISNNGYYSKLNKPKKHKISKQYIPKQDTNHVNNSKAQMISDSAFKHYLYMKLCEILNLYSGSYSKWADLFYSLNNLFLSSDVTVISRNSFYRQWVRSQDVVNNLYKGKPYYDDKLVHRLLYLSTHKGNLPVIMLYKEHDYIPLTFNSLMKATWNVYDIIFSSKKTFTAMEKNNCINWVQTKIKYA